MKSSNHPFTSVVSLHTNTFGCGVAKFSKQLAKRLGVPFYGLRDHTVSSYPLFSLKASEMDGDDRWSVLAICESLRRRGYLYAVLWHDKGIVDLDIGPSCVFYADPAHGSPSLWCPAMVFDPPVPRAAINLFAMGMAHKAQPQHYKTLASLIAKTPHTFQLRMSMGIHEGHDLQDAVLKCEAVAQAIGPENLSVLGILTDTAVASEYEQCQAVCAFFESGARANNSTVHAAMAAGKPVVTNLDEHSPKEWEHNVTVFDIHQLTSWPGIFDLERVGKNGQNIYRECFSWDRFMERLHAAVTDRQPSR